MTGKDSSDGKRTTYIHTPGTRLQALAVDTCGQTVGRSVAGTAAVGSGDVFAADSVMAESALHRGRGSRSVVAVCWPRRRDVVSASGTKPPSDVPEKNSILAPSARSPDGGGTARSRKAYGGETTRNMAALRRDVKRVGLLEK